MTFSPPSQLTWHRHRRRLTRPLADTVDCVDPAQQGWPNMFFIYIHLNNILLTLFIICKLNLRNWLVYSATKIPERYYAGVTISFPQLILSFITQSRQEQRSSKNMNYLYLNWLMRLNWHDPDWVDPAGGHNMTSSRNRLGWIETCDYITDTGSKRPRD